MGEEGKGNGIRAIGDGEWGGGMERARDGKRMEEGMERKERGGEVNEI